MKQIIYISTILLLLWGCRETIVENGDNTIRSFSFQQKEIAIDTIRIDSANIWILLAQNADVSSLTPVIEIPENAAIYPESGIAQDFTNPVNYTVTAENGKTRTYTATALQPQDFAVTAFSFPDIYVTGAIREDSITLTVPYGTNTAALRPVFSLINATGNSSLQNGVEADFQEPVDWVLSKGSISKTYHITVCVSPQETGIRAVWVTNVSSSALFSENNLNAMIDNLAQLNFNTICVSVYNKGQTLFPSRTLADVLGTTPDAVVFDNCSWGDVLGKLIEKAHAKNIKVIAWFEYGFASHYQGQAGKIADAKPEWISKDINGNMTEKNGFYWLNGFHAGVRKFITDLVVECVHHYPGLDGIQGDDRLPALPAHAGYDDYTRQLYLAETGKNLPSNPAENAFLNWKVDKMTGFAVSLYQAVKAERNTCIVCWAPSVQGWAKTNYLQDWPEWIKRGVADFVSPQLYRTETQGIGVYSTLVYNDMTTAFNTNALLKKYVPGMLVKNGTYLPSDDYLAQMISYHRNRGIYSESTWFYEAVSAKQKVYKAFYPGPALFPELTP